MRKPRFTIVTATAWHGRTLECLESWDLQATDGSVVVSQRQGWEAGAPGTAVACAVPDYLGPVPAFKLGVDLALQITAPDGVIACLHDDLLIEEENWGAKVMAFFNQHPEVGLVGFGGGRGLGSDDIYQAPYSPMQLARQDFVSNMRDAEAHGRRVTVPTRVACLDGFSQIGRVAFWRGRSARVDLGRPDQPSLWLLEQQGVVHHAYDAFLGAHANNRGWQVYMLPIACHHYGGQTAVGDAGYAEWAKRQTGEHQGGDAQFWQESHRIVYDLLRGVLPIRIED